MAISYTTSYDPTTGKTTVTQTPDTSTPPTTAPVDVSVNPNTGKTNAQVLAESTAVAQNAAKMIGTTYTPPTSTPTINSTNLGSTTTPQLPTPSASSVNTAYIGSLQAEADKQRKAVEDAYKAQIDQINAQKQETQAKIDNFTTLQQTGALNNIDQLTQPFRQQLEAQQRDTLYVNENFQANQKLTNELDSLLTQGNNLIAQQKAEGGLSSIATANVNKTISDVNARAGVIQAVMSARNGQISQAYTMIDRTVTAINADRQDRIDYFKTLYNFYGDQKSAEQNKLTALTADEKTYVNAQIGLLENDMKQAQDNAQKLKDALTNPDTALTYANAGVTLNDTPDQINQKLAQYAYTQEIAATSNKLAQAGYKAVVPGQSAPNGSQVFSVTDSKGKITKYYKPTDLAAGGGNNILSIADAKALGVPYGTTQSQAIAMGKTPGASGAGTMDQSSVAKEATDKIGFIDTIMNAPGLDSRVGPTPMTRRTFAIKDMFGSGQAFAGYVHQLTNQLTLQNLIDAKAQGATFGALSEGELNLLASAATAISGWEIWTKDGREVPPGTTGATPSGEWNIDEGTFKKELQKIKDLTQLAATKKLGYDPTQVTPEDVQQINDVFTGTNNSSSTEFNPANFY